MALGACRGSGCSLIFLDTGELRTLDPFATPIFPGQETPREKDLRGQNIHSGRTHSQALIPIGSHLPPSPTSPSLPLSRGPLLVSLTPDLIPQASMAPYCPEMKSRLPILASGASHDLSQLTSLHPQAPASSQTFHVGLHQPHGPE